MDSYMSMSDYNTVLHSSSKLYEKLFPHFIKSLHTSEGSSAIKQMLSFIKPSANDISLPQQTHSHLDTLCKYHRHIVYKHIFFLFLMTTFSSFISIFAEVINCLKNPQHHPLATYPPLQYLSSIVESLPEALAEGGNEGERWHWPMDVQVAWQQSPEPADRTGSV